MKKTTELCIPFVFTSELIIMPTTKDPISQEELKKLISEANFDESN